ncbi:MAG TPA: PilN domain-containing protein [Terriglobia bacterium]|nr:PilN domain-containing protein [Terriglobia bacterium]
MIRVNLADKAKKRVAAAATPRSSMNLLPLIHLMIVVGTALGGYLWYSSLTSQIESLDANIRAEEEQRQKLEAVYKQNQTFEARKRMLESRLKVVRSLRANQVSPVVSLDKISDAVTRTNQREHHPYIWLSRLEQNSSIFNVTGVSTSVLGIADFIANLESTGYFRNIVQFNAQDSAGNYNFTLSCEYAPPRTSAPGPRLAGAN